MVTEMDLRNTGSCTACCYTITCCVIQLVSLICNILVNSVVDRNYGSCSIVSNCLIRCFIFDRCITDCFIELEAHARSSLGRCHQLGGVCQISVSCQDTEGYAQPVGRLQTKWQLITAGQRIQSCDFPSLQLVCTQLPRFGLEVPECLALGPALLGRALL